MDMTTLGKTGLHVSRLGVGLAEIGSEVDAEQAGNVLNGALDAGISFLDTASCYGDSEELIGKTVANRRDEYSLVTKAGHSRGGFTTPDWTAGTVAQSIDRSLRRLKTDHVEVVQLHSCGIDVLERGDVVEALQSARDAGKTRFIGYSGDNEAARWAVDSGLFDTLQTSFSLVDQHARTKGLLAAADSAGMGIIIKRPIANAAWGRSSSPATYADRYFSRAREMSAAGPIPGAPDDPILLSMGFTFAHQQVDTAILGTRNPDHMRANIAMFESSLSIAREAVEELRSRFDELGADWLQNG